MDINVEVEEDFCYLTWQAALTPHGAMIPPDDIFGEAPNNEFLRPESSIIPIDTIPVSGCQNASCQDQSFTMNSLPEDTPALLLEGLEEFYR